MKKICVYGKGGIGKSTTVSNLAAAMAERGLKVAVVGCDPKADSTRNIMGRRIPTVLQTLREGSEQPVAYLGYRDILCIEAGGPEPGTGCAGRGIIAAMSEINARNLLSDRDVVLYDVLGDVVCGGFSMPLREGIADEVYLVTTSDFMAIYAANNICRGIRKYAQTGTVRLAGIIHNGRSSVDYPENVHAFAEKVGTEVVGYLPMTPELGRAELERKTMLERDPGHPVSQCFRNLAETILRRTGGCIPTPLSDEEVEELCRRTMKVQ